MKTNYTILCILFLLSALSGCTAESGMDFNEPPTASHQEAQVLFSLAVPSQGIPSATRTMANDSEIKNFTIWAFSGTGNLATFQKQVNTEDAVIRNVNGQMQMFVLLPESTTPITLAMIVNTTVQSTPVAGTSKEEALKQLTYSIQGGQPTTMPMYGEQELLCVKQGMPQSFINLRRAMAQIKVDISESYSQFVLEEVKVLNITKEGYVHPASSAIESRFNYTKTINAASKEENHFSCYTPEVLDINGKTRVSVLLKGLYKGDGRITYYRLDFVSGKTQIKNIARNYKYLFNITNVKATGFSSESEAIKATNPSNASTTGSVEGGWMLIDDEAIMDITTDGTYYLGVTSGKLQAGSNGSFYFANFGVVTNNTKDGWKIVADELPAGVTLNKESHKPSADLISQAESIWVYIDKGTYRGDQVLKIFIYSASIRKKIEITLPIEEE